jgi:hypothetical protein
MKTFAEFLHIIPEGEERYKIIGVNCYFCKNMKKLPTFYDCNIDADMINSDNCPRFEKNHIPLPQLVATAINYILDDFRDGRISNDNVQKLTAKLYKKIY